MSALRPQVEDFLYAEANLLDEWRLDEWFALFSDDATYEIPTAGMPDSANAGVSLFYVADDRTRLRERVVRLNDPDAHSEQPRSWVRRIYGNVRVEEEGDIGQARQEPPGRRFFRACDLPPCPGRGQLENCGQARLSRHGLAASRQDQHHSVGKQLHDRRRHSLQVACLCRA
jgi:hypothetical protein